MFSGKFKIYFRGWLFALVLAASFEVFIPVQAAPSPWCKQILTKVNSFSIAQKIKALNTQFDKYIKKNQKQTWDELSKRRANIKPLLYVRTFVESSVVFWAVIYGMHGIEILDAATGLNLFGGNTAGPEVAHTIIKNPAFMFFLLSVYAPLCEEFSFRFAPRAFLGKSWKVGVASSLVFGFAHNIHQIPLPQIIDGFYFWYLMKNRGITHSLLAHSVTNTWVIIGTLYL